MVLVVTTKEGQTVQHAGIRVRLRRARNGRATIEIESSLTVEPDEGYDGPRKPDDCPLSELPGRDSGDSNAGRLSD